MLMITKYEDSGPIRTFKLEGKLFGPWIEELQAAYDSSQVTPAAVRLDLLGLNYVDPEGSRFLAGLIRDGASVTACSGFVAEMLQLEDL